MSVIFLLTLIEIIRGHLSRDSTSRRQSLIHSTLVTLKYLLAVTVGLRYINASSIKKYPPCNLISMDWRS